MLISEVAFVAFRDLSPIFALIGIGLLLWGAVLVMLGVEEGFRLFFAGVIAVAPWMLGSSLSPIDGSLFEGRAGPVLLFVFLAFPVFSWAVAIALLISFARWAWHRH
ncbi:hypothetical protein [Alcanivorax sp.]|uniref:hypothetical protein n=1 Tax=Alcanivorax sp. TaxID=1872427 RepID=UPI00258EF02F|nr:hypothetical protein [Alcanivorax sp.]